MTHIDFPPLWLFGLSQIQPKTRPMHYTDPLLCFIIKAEALGLQTLCPLSVTGIAKVVLILDPISPCMPQFRTDNYKHSMSTVQPVQRFIDSIML